MLWYADLSFPEDTSRIQGQLIDRQDGQSFSESLPVFGTVYHKVLRQHLMETSASVSPDDCKGCQPEPYHILVGDRS
eukprot:1136642-Amphidinium_carterae.1